MKRPVAILLLVASALLHWPLGVAEFAFDDNDFIQVNGSIRSFSQAFAAFGAPFPPDQPERALYRPLTNLSYAIDFAVDFALDDAPDESSFSQDARYYHCTNVLLYLVVVLLVHRLALAYFKREGPALAVGLVYALHPVHTAAVDALAGRSELLALCFGLSSILLFLRAVKTEERSALLLAASVLSYGLSCLAKENGALLPAVLAFHLLCCHPPVGKEDELRRNRAIRSLIPFFFVLVAYVALRYAVLGRFSPEQSVLVDQSLGVRVLTMGAVFFQYLRLLVFPRILQVDYYYHDVVGIPTALSPAIMVGLIGLVMASLALVLLVAGRLKATPDGGTQSNRLVAIIGLAFFLVYVFPISHVLDIGALMAERFLFTPSLGFVLLLIATGDWLLSRSVADPTRRRIVATALLVPICLLGAWRSASRAAEWRDGVRLWQATAEAIPWDTRVQLNLAVAYLQRGELDEAQPVLAKLLKSDPQNIEALGNLGALQLWRGEYASARQTFERLLAIQPQSFIAWNNLGLAEAHLQRHTVAVEHYRRALRLNPNYQPALANLQESQRLIGEAKRYLEHYREGALSSGDPVQLRNIVAACSVIGDEACAVRFESLAAQHEGR